MSVWLRGKGGEGRWRPKNKENVAKVDDAWTRGWVGGWWNRRVGQGGSCVPGHGGVLLLLLFSVRSVARALLHPIPGGRVIVP